jgi:acyl-CoA reductase-like NAD-dependent aldehyde dehydrogenase
MLPTTDVPASTPRLSVVNPSSGEILRELSCATATDVLQAVARAREAQANWNETSVKRRLSIIKQFQRLLNDRKQQVARTITSEAGKPYAESLLTEILVVLDTCRFLLDETYGFLQGQPVPHGSLATKLKHGRLLREPHGVIGIISPWNYPFSIPATEALAALVTGNTVVLKPSELTPLSSLELASLLHEAGVPLDTFRVMIGVGETGSALVESGIDKLIFTGSVATGKRIAQLAATRLLPVVLELGGKNPMIVLDDAEVEVASSGAVWAAFINAGQACLSIERCYVHRSIYERFVFLCAEKAKRLRVGDGMNPEVDVGPLIHERQFRIIEQHIEDARARGARVVAGGERLTSLGANFFAPTVLADVSHEMRVMREETFGPVLPIMPFDNEDEAIRLANDTDYGLSASVWTRDRPRGEKIARQIKSGTVMVNDAVSCFAITEAPHGGVKASGIGHTHGRFGLEEMVRIKYLDSDLVAGVKKPWWYGYGPKMADAAESFLDFQFARGMTQKLKGAVQGFPLITRRKL